MKSKTIAKKSKLAEFLISYDIKINVINKYLFTLNN